MSIIAIDMDEVIADFNSELIVRFNRCYSKSIKLDDLKGVKLQSLYPSLSDEIDEMINCDSFFRNLNVIPDSQVVIESLFKRHEVFIASAAMDHSNSLDAKLSWLNKNFPFIKNSNIIFCGSKSIINADYLIDDHPHHFERFVGKGVLFTAPHNLNFEYSDRVNSWLDVAKYFLR